MRIIFLLLMMFFTSSVNRLTAQDTLKPSPKALWRINIINPSLEYEMPLWENFVMSMSGGVGGGVGYPHSTYKPLNPGKAFKYVIAPFIDVQSKWLYSVQKRKIRGKTIQGNSSNFLSWRLLSRLGSVKENIKRTSKFDFLTGPTWGMQRTYGRVHLLFDLGPAFYWDVRRYGGFIFLNLQLNVGYQF